MVATPDFLRRFSDNSDEPESTHSDTEGIARRIINATPGHIISLREGTEDMPFDYRGVTWGEVMKALKESGVTMMRDGKTIKTTPAFMDGDFLASTEVQLAKIVDQIDMESRTFDIATSEGLRSFSKLVISESTDGPGSSRFSKGDQLVLTDALMEVIGEVDLDDLKNRHSHFCAELRRKFETIIQRPGAHLLAQTLIVKLWNKMMDPESPLRR